MSPQIRFRKQIEILFEHAQSQGIPTAYRTIAQMTRETPGNIRKIHIGGNGNPGYRTLRALLDYFGAGMAYLDCRSAEACRDYLQTRTQTMQLEGIARQVDGLPSECLTVLLQMAEYMRRAHGLPTSDDAVSRHSETAEKTIEDLVDVPATVPSESLTQEGKSGDTDGAFNP